MNEIKKAIADIGEIFKDRNLKVKDQQEIRIYRHFNNFNVFTFF